MLEEATPASKKKNNNGRESFKKQQTFELAFEEGFPLSEKGDISSASRNNSTCLAKKSKWVWHD